MKSRLVSLGVLLLVGLAWAAPCPAQCIDEFFHSVARDVKRRNCWPRPFVCPDRQAVREPFGIMVANGWERQNLLGAQYFDPGTSQLNEAGRLKVLWIINEAPEQHRTVYVRRATTPQETAARMAAVTQLVAQACPAGQMLPVYESSRSDEGWPAERVDIIGRKAMAATPDPKLPSNSQGGSSSGSSGTK